MMFRPYAALGFALLAALAAPAVAQSQAASAGEAGRPTCAALLAAEPARSASPVASDAAADTAAARTEAGASIGGAQTESPDIILHASVQANEVRFASQPRVRVRFCWGGDTLRVVSRENIPTPVVAGTTYRNVYVAVELLGRLNAECLSERITGQTGVGTNTPSGGAATTSRCAFLGVSGAAGRQPPESQAP